MGAEMGGGGWIGVIYLCGLGHALAEDFDLYVAEGGVECDGHGGLGLSRMPLRRVEAG